MKFNYFSSDKYEIKNKQKCFRNLVEMECPFYMYGVKTGESFNDDDSYNDDVIKWMTERELIVLGVKVNG